MEYKGYMVVPVRTFAMVEIKAKGQGKVPKDLSGMFTGMGEAYKAIDGYLQSLIKGNRVGKTKGTSTG